MRHPKEKTLPRLTKSQRFSLWAWRCEDKTFILVSPVLCRSLVGLGLTLAVAFDLSVASFIGWLSKSKFFISFPNAADYTDICLLFSK